MKSKLTLIALALLALSTLNPQLSTWAQGAPGDLDTTFAGTGQSSVGFGGGVQSCDAAAVQADGKLVLAGYGYIELGDLLGLFQEFEIVRFDTNNVLDASFGAGGAVFTSFNPTSIYAQGSRATAVIIQSDGKIVAAGWADTGAIYEDFGLTRYNPDGSLEISFGTGGRVITDFGTDSSIQAMVIQSDGKIVVAGYAGNSFALARYQTNGVLDSSFGSGGTMTTYVDGLVGNGAGLLIEADGKYVEVGYGQGDFAVCRYTTNGILDTTER